MTYDRSDPTTIERELAETRARLDSRLDELTNRLSPGRLVDDGLDYLRHGQGAQFVRNLGSQVRDNPLPVALSSIGLAWLMATSAMSASTTGEHRRDANNSFDDVAARAQRAGASVVRITDESEDAFEMRVAEARAKVLGLQKEATELGSVFVGRVQEALETAQQVARERLAAIGETASDWSVAVADRTQRTSEAVGEAARQSRDMAVQAGHAIADTVNQNPMLLGALGLAAGVLLAALLPVTEQEESLVAPVGAAIRGTAEEAIDRGKRAAAVAADSAYHEFAEP